MVSNQPEITERQLVVFDLDDEEYGIDIGIVREIIPMQEITPVTGDPRFTIGTINLRGQVVPVVELRSRLLMPSIDHTDEQRIVVVEVGGHDVGMIVDAVTEVSRISEASVQASPPGSPNHHAGIVKTDEKDIILLEITSVVTVSETSTLREDGGQINAA